MNDVRDFCLDVKLAFYRIGNFDHNRLKGILCFLQREHPCAFHSDIDARCERCGARIWTEEEWHSCFKEVNGQFIDRGLEEVAG